jgi:hypothetical protein
MEKKLYRPSFETRLPEQEEDIDLEAFPGQNDISPEPNVDVDEEKSDGSASAFEGTEVPREYDDRDLSDKDLDDLLADEA